MGQGDSICEYQALASPFRSWRHSITFRSAKSWSPECPSLAPSVSARMSAGAHRLLLPRFLVGIDQGAGPGLGWPDDRLRSAVTKLIEVVGLRVLNLCPKHARLRPFAVLAEREVARHGLEARLVHILGELVVI